MWKSERTKELEAKTMQNDYPLNTVIDGISNQDYHNHAAIGSSQCKNLLKSPWHFEYNRKHPKPPTAAMQFGSLVHQLVLEPEIFEQNYFVAVIYRPNGAT